MSNQRIFVVILLFSFMVFLGNLLMSRSASDSRQIRVLITENNRLHQAIDEATSDLNYTQRLNDLLAGRLFELLRFTTGKVDPSLDALQKIVDKIESDLSKIELRRQRE